MSALAQVHAIVRNDADEAVKRVAETEARKALVQNLCDRVATQHNRGIALADELEDLRQQNAELRADNAGLKERIAELEEPISEPPSSSPAVADETHQPGGELHALTAVQDPEPWTSPTPANFRRLRSTLRPTRVACRSPTAMCQRATSAADPRTRPAICLKSLSFLDRPNPSTKAKFFRSPSASASTSDDDHAIRSAAL